MLRQANVTVEDLRQQQPSRFRSRFRYHCEIFERWQRSALSTFLGGNASGSAINVALKSKWESVVAASALGTGLSLKNPYQGRCESDICGTLFKLDSAGREVLAAT